MKTGTFLHVLRVPVLILLAVFLVVHGIVPGFTRMDTDFPNYYTAGRVVVSGEGVGRLYDDGWFQARMAREGVEGPGKFSPNPPAMALASAPLGFFRPTTALRLMTTMSLVALLVSIVLLKHIMQTDMVNAALLALLSGVGLANNFRFGQVYVLLSCSLLLGYWFWRRGNPVLAGLLIGAGIPLKYIAIALLPLLVVRRQLRVAAWAAGTAALIVVSAVAVLGWEIHAEFLDRILGNHLSGNLSMQSPFAIAFQSFGSFYRSLFLADARWNPVPAVPSGGLFIITMALTYCAIIGVAATLVYRLRQADPAGSFAIPLVLTAALLLAPATGTYHYVLLWLPLALIAAELRGQPGSTGLVLLSAAIGFIPYSRIQSLHPEGLLFFLNYPRLILLSVMFVIIARLALRALAGHRQVNGIAGSTVAPVLTEPS